ncbi:MAG: filamentous hemagglutinin N-terminal domain-containing protein, partial [Cellvibrionaceae bacterium]|nr:filamentous hemagglutinin N-terminal domain-containing protein [Cellvibrionaceae bacterium]
MNRVFRIIWHEASQAWVVVSEFARAHGKCRAALSLLAALGLCGGGNVLAQAGVVLPEGEQVVAGEASYQRRDNELFIEQYSDELITNWDSFSIGEEAAVHFIQPDADSTALNRVIGQDPSQILGRLSANGQVFLLNPNGVVFGRNSRVDVSALTASTLDIDNADFLAGNYHFAGAGGGRIDAAGQINLGAGGRLAFVAPLIEHSGSINTQGGEVIMAAGTDVELDLDGSGLMNFRINRGALESLINNSGAIVVGAGQVMLSAQAYGDASRAVINNSGTIEARGIRSEGGRIMLSAGADGDINHSGLIDVSSAEAGGGLVTMEAESIELAAASSIDARGASGGGAVLVGGDWQGGANQQRRVLADADALAQAKTVRLAEDASIDASASVSGDGGTVVLWSDIELADSRTYVHGNIYSYGGANGGNGGQVETSGHYLNIEGAEVSTRAPKGQTGDWLLDPGHITIANVGSDIVNSGVEPSGNTTISTASLSNALNSNNVTLTTGNGGYDITLLDDFHYSGAASSLTLDAGSAINLNGSIYSSSALDISFNDSVRLRDNVVLNTAGGDVQFRGLVDGFSNLSVNTGAGDIYLMGNVGNAYPLDQLWLQSGGNIYLGQGGNPIVIQSYGSQSYSGDMILRGQTTLRSLSQSALNFGSGGNLNLAGQSARLRITIKGADGGVGGEDPSDRGNGGSGGAGQRAVFIVRVENETLSGSIGGSGGNGSYNGSGAGGGYSSFGYNGGRGGAEGGANKSGDGGGGGAASVVRFGSGGDLVAGGGGGGGGGQNKQSGGGGGSSPAGINSGSIVGATGGYSSADTGGGGGGGGGLYG